VRELLNQLKDQLDKDDRVDKEKHTESDTHEQVPIACPLQVGVNFVNSCKLCCRKEHERAQHGELTKDEGPLEVGLPLLEEQLLFLVAVLVQRGGTRDENAPLVEVELKREEHKHEY
jgi:hypothetical protein